MSLVSKLRVRACNDYITVKPVNVISQSTIIIPESVDHFFFYATITSVGEKCNKVIKPGMQAFIKRKKNRAQGHEVDGDPTYIFKQDAILLLKWRGQWHPVGNKIMVMRNVEEEIVNGVIIPACFQTKDQTLLATVLRFGLVRKLYDNGFIYEDIKEETDTFNYPLNMGDRIKIKEWALDIQEIGMDNLNCLIIKPSHLDYKIE